MPGGTPLLLFAFRRLKWVRQRFSENEKGKLAGWQMKDFPAWAQMFLNSQWVEMYFRVGNFLVHSWARIHLRRHKDTAGCLRWMRIDVFDCFSFPFPVLRRIECALMSIVLGQSIQKSFGRWPAQCECRLSSAHSAVKCCDCSHGQVFDWRESQVETEASGIRF